MINKVTLIGRTTKEPELRTLQSGNTVTSFTLAVERNFKNQDGERQTDFIPIIAWNKTAELICDYVNKGNMLGISGSIQTRTYENNSGKTVYVTEVNANEVQFLTPKNNNNSNTEYNPFEDDDEVTPF